MRENQEAAKWPPPACLLLMCRVELAGRLFVCFQSAPHQLHADADIDALVVVEVPFALATLHGAAVSLLLANERFVG